MYLTTKPSWCPQASDMNKRLSDQIPTKTGTDVLALLVAHFNEVACIKLCMKFRTSVKPKYIRFHTICEILATSQEDLTNIIPFHANPGCDTMSNIGGQGKKTAWKEFCSNPDLIASLCKADFHDETLELDDKFICRMYNHAAENSFDHARVVLFGKCRLPEALPTISNALQLHVQRANYQSLVWIQATCNIPLLPQPETMGWSKGNGKLVPILMTVNIPNT